MENRYYSYEELSETAKKVAVAEFQARQDDVVFDNEKNPNWKTERFAKQWFSSGYGWFFYEDGTRAQEGRCNNGRNQRNRSY